MVIHFSNSFGIFYKELNNIPLKGKLSSLRSQLETWNVGILGFCIASLSSLTEKTKIH
jgi:hypothetical protein